MKKVLALLVLSAVAVSASANTMLLNGHVASYFPWVEEDGGMIQAGVTTTFLFGEERGVYLQANPNIAIYQFDIGGPGYEWMLEDVLVIGLGGIVGYGADFSFGQSGILFGGGAYIDPAWYHAFDGNDVFLLMAGLGTGVNYYYTLGNGLLLDAGLTVAWAPFAMVLYESGNNTDFFFGRFYFNFNIGVGWRY